MSNICRAPGVLAALLLLTTLVGLSFSLDEERQTFGGYTAPNCSSNGYGLIGRYNYNLAGSGFDNAYRGVGSGFGIWIFYDLPGYQGDSEVVTLTGWSQCVPLVNLAGRVSSVRYAGDGFDVALSNHGARATITLYEGANFTGRELYITADHVKTLFGSRDQTHAGWAEDFGSYIITGDVNSCWTLHFAAGFNQERDMLCVCGYDSPFLEPRLARSNPFPPHNKIGSVRKGCSWKSDVEDGDSTQIVAGPTRRVQKDGTIIFE